MMHFSVQPSDQMFVKDYGFSSFAKNMGKKIGKNISKNLSGKYSQKFLIILKQSATDALKASSKRVIQKTAVKLVIRFLIELVKFQKIHNKVIQRQF